MFQGPEQQMISSSKAKDKANKSSVFCWEKLKKRKRHFLSFLSSCSTGLVLESKCYLLQSLLCFAFSIVRPCWPLHETKAYAERYWPSCTQAKWVLRMHFFWLRIHHTYAEAWEFPRARAEPLNLLVRSAVLLHNADESINTKADPQLMAGLFASGGIAVLSHGGVSSQGYVEINCPMITQHQTKIIEGLCAALY